jgi:hypothetical protein
VDSDQARDLYRQVLALRELLEAVARELERLAATEPDPERRGMLRRWAREYIRLRSPSASCAAGFPRLAG